MSFEHLNFWWIVPVVLVLWVLHVLFWWKKRNIFKQTRNLPLLEKEYPLLRKFFLLFALIFLSIALLSPTWGEGRKKVESSGKDVIFVLDLSNSMLCQDVSPSRLKISKFLIEEIVRRGGGDDRFALIGFASEGRIFSPFTSSREGFLKILDFLEPDVLRQGTDINAALKKVLKLIEKSPKRGKTVVILTDGEFHGENWEDTAASLSKSGVKTFVVGVGTASGGNIVLSDGSIKMDSLGREVITALRKEEIEKLAAGLNADELILTEVSVTDVIKRVLEGAMEMSRFHFITYSIPRGYIFVFLFFISLSLSLFWSRR
ncbi:MAG: VWA domain-containing protein [Candidatus Aminicenantes bacterium]|nr:VWA domain-containing protein [Candidatus Aminicenantes bacterium]